MQGIFARSLDKIEKEDLLELVDVRALREYISLDYKKTSYDRGHSGAVNLLSDVTAMANARGGYIVIGVEEDREALDGTPKAVLGIDRGDDETVRIQSVCLSSIDQPIPGLRVRDIPLSNGRSCVVIQIPNSIRKPHMVVHKKHRSFHVRHGRSNTPVGMQEVRDMILSMQSYRENLADFLRNRREAAASIAPGAPFLFLAATPIYVDTDKLDPLSEANRELLQNVPGNPDTRYERIFPSSPSPRIFGIEARPYGSKQDSSPAQLLRLFRNGHIEFYENHAPYAGNEWPNKAMPLDSYRVTVALIHFLEIARRVFEQAELSEPIAITVTLGKISPSYLQYWSTTARPILRDVFIWEEGELLFDLTANDLSHPNTIAAALSSRLFNAYGYEKSSHFNEADELIKLK